MFIEIRHLKAFLAVASQLHFGRAARQLNIAQPALSRTIQHLEALLGAQLLERTSRIVQLTESGHVFREHATRAMQQVNLGAKAAKRAANGDAGSITIGYVDFALTGPMPEIIKRFKQRHPAISVELVRENPESLAASLADRQLDCGFILATSGHDTLDTRCVQSEFPVVVLPVSHRLGLKSKLRLTDLAAEPFIIATQNGWRSFYQVIERLSIKAGFMLEICQEVGEIDAMLALISAEMGIGVCPESIRMMPRSGVVTRPLLDTGLTFDVHFSWHKDSSNQCVADLGVIVADYAARHPPMITRDREPEPLRSVS
jgi:DNA-binding transcriptional LysR family regulator